jgi:tetratricopeptide (TPR) repeat protein
LVKVAKPEIASFTESEKTEPAVDFCDEGMSAYENEDYDSALEHLKKCVEENDSDVEYLKALGDSYKEANNHAQAIIYYEKVIDIDSDDYNSRWILASEYIREKKFIEAEEQINYILDSDADEEIKQLARKLEIVVKNYNK